MPLGRKSSTSAIRISGVGGGAGGGRGGSPPPGPGRRTSSVKKSAIPRPNHASSGLRHPPKMARSSNSNHLAAGPSSFRSSSCNPPLGSSSRNSRSAAKPNLVTPARARSHSATRTPQRVLQPLSLNPNRYSMSSNRGSTIGAKVRLQCN